MNDCKFSAEEKQPKLLPCLHRSCEACLEKYYAEGLQQSGDDEPQQPPSGSSSTYACHEPHCKRLIGRKPEQLPYDELLIRELQESAQASCQGCEESSAFATHHCGTCEVLLCSSCVEAHKTNLLRFMRSHPLISIAEYRAQRAAGDSATPPRCVLHNEEPIKMFCKTCNVAICLLCGTMLHPQGDLHQVVTLEAGMPLQKEKLAALATTMDETNEKATAAAATVTSVKEELESNIQSAKDVVEADFKLIAQAVVRCREERLATIEAAGKDKVKALEDQTTELENRAAAAGMASEFSLKLVIKGNQYETLQMANFVVEGMADIVDDVPQHEPVRVAKFEFQGISGGLDAIVKVIEAYGNVLDYGGLVNEGGDFVFGAPLAEQLACSKTLSPGRQGYVCSIASFVNNKGERFVATAHGNNAIIVWQVSNGQQIRTLPGHSGRAIALVIVPGDTAEDAVLASASYDKTVRIWNPFTGQAIRTLSGHTNYVYGLAVHQDEENGTVLASASQDTTIRLWSLPDGKHVKTLSGHSSIVYAVTFFQEGDATTLASGSADNTIRIWKYPSGEAIRTLTGHTGAVHGLTTMNIPETAETTLISASADKTIRLWHPSTGECFRTLNGHTDQVFCLYPFYRGANKTPCLISGGRYKKIHVWDVVEGKEIQSLTGHTNHVCCLHVIPSFDDAQKSILASGSADTTVRFWE